MTARFPVDTIAAACHSAWYAYAVLALGEEGEPWDSAPEWQKSSIRSAVAFWHSLWDGDADKARREMPEASHTNWCSHKEREGWVYGEEKDPEKKTHHCLVPYADLPEAQRKKDLVVVEAYIAMRQSLKRYDEEGWTEAPPSPL